MCRQHVEEGQRHHIAKKMNDMCSNTYNQEHERHDVGRCSQGVESACVLKVWGVVPTSLVEAERNGATFVQRLTKIDASGSSSSSNTAVTDPTDSNNKKANGHKEEGQSLHPLRCFTQDNGQSDRRRQTAC